jgi:hypothetical protein
MALKFFTVSPQDANAVTIEITTPTKSYIITCKGPSELGRVVQFAVQHGYVFQLKNGLDMAWVEQVRTNINNGYSYLTKEAA